MMGLLEGVKLRNVASKHVGSFSGGMKRRLSVAVSLVGQPKVVVLDEPTTGMDPMNRKFVWGEIKKMKADRSVLLTTHSMEEADALGDRIGIMSAGQLVALGTSIHLKDKFGEGYRVKVVVPRAARAVMKATVAEIMPQAVLVDENAGDMSYALVDPTTVAAAPKLFSFIEEVKEGRHAECTLTDWGVSHTSLEDVFLRLAKEHARGGEKFKAFFEVPVGGQWSPGEPWTYVAADGFEYVISPSKMPVCCASAAALLQDLPHPYACTWLGVVRAHTLEHGTDTAHRVHCCVADNRAVGEAQGPRSRWAERGDMVRRARVAASVHRAEARV